MGKFAAEGNANSDSQDEEPVEFSSPLTGGEKADTLVSERGGRLVSVHILKPTVLQAAGTPPKTIEEFVGRVNSQTAEVSMARMKSPPGWSEPAQTPQFDEYTVVLKGCLHVDMEGEEFDVSAGQAVIAKAGQRVRYSTPSPEGAEYIAVCIPAFSPDLVRRESEKT
jgi:ethanolamine utilization protein EutQ